MQKMFHRILVPVDFSYRSVKAVEKAVVMAAAYQCNVSLLHVVAPPMVSPVSAGGLHHVPYDLIDNRNELEFQLVKLADTAVQKVPSHVFVSTNVVWGYWDEAVIEYVKNYNIDCVMVGQRSRFKKKRHMLLNPDKVAEATNIPVITLPVNKKLTGIKSIVIPITDFFPKRKLLYGLYIANENDAAIELLAVEQEQKSEITDYYLNMAADWVLKHGGEVKLNKVQHNNIPAAVTEFANKHNTDLIILNPGLQTTLPGWWSSLLGNIIQKYTSPPVMTVTPA